MRPGLVTRWRPPALRKESEAGAKRTRSGRNEDWIAIRVGLPFLGRHQLPRPVILARSQHPARYAKFLAFSAAQHRIPHKVVAKAASNAR